MLAQPAVVRRAVNLSLIDSGPLEKIMGHRENPQWKSLKLIIEKAEWDPKVHFQRDLIHIALSNKNQGISH